MNIHLLKMLLLLLLLESLLSLLLFFVTSYYYYSDCNCYDKFFFFLSLFQFSEDYLHNFAPLALQVNSVYESSTMQSLEIVLLKVCMVCIGVFTFQPYDWNNVNIM